MRIALVNNQNNLLFSATRYLRDAGYDATLLLMDNEAVEAPHFHPSCDTFDLDYQGYTRELAWGTSKSFETHDFAQVARDLAPYDFVIGCGSMPAYMNRIGRTLDIFVPFGGDIFEAPFYPPSFNRRSLRSLVTFPFFQRRGIRAARALFADHSPIGMEPSIARLGYTGKRIAMPPPLLYGPTYAEDALRQHLARTHWFPLVRELRDRTDVLMTQHARHMWAKPSFGNWSKGNDKLFRAVAAAKRARPSARFGIVTYEYGPDVPESRALIQELGLERDVLWLPKSTRKDVMANLLLSDFGCGEMADHSWYTCGTIVEVLCMGKVLFHRREDADFAAHHADMYPMIDVKSPADIQQALEGFLDQPERYREMGRRSRAWFDKHMALGMAAIIDRIEGR